MTDIQSEAEDLFAIATKLLTEPGTIKNDDVGRVMSAGLIVIAISEDGYYYCPTPEYNEMAEERYQKEV